MLVIISQLNMENVWFPISWEFTQGKNWSCQSMLWNKRARNRSRVWFIMQLQCTVMIKPARRWASFKNNVQRPQFCSYFIRDMRDLGNTKLWLSTIATSILRLTSKHETSQSCCREVPGVGDQQLQTSLTVFNRVVNYLSWALKDIHSLGYSLHVYTESEKSLLKSRTYVVNFVFTTSESLLANWQGTLGTQHNISTICFGLLRG